MKGRAKATAGGVSIKESYGRLIWKLILFFRLICLKCRVTGTEKEITWGLLFLLQVILKTVFQKF